MKRTPSVNLTHIISIVFVVAVLFTSYEPARFYYCLGLLFCCGYISEKASGLLPAYAGILFSVVIFWIMKF